MLFDSYDAIDKYLKRGKNLNDRPTPGHKNNTRFIRYNSQAVGINFYDKPVIIYHRNGDIQLNANGYNTKTTRDRINQWQKTFRVMRGKDYKWYIRYNGLFYLFKEDIVLQPDGTVIHNGGKVIPQENVETW